MHGVLHMLLARCATTGTVCGVVVKFADDTTIGRYLQLNSTYFITRKARWIYLLIDGAHAIKQ